MKNNFEFSSSRSLPLDILKIVLSFSVVMFHMQAFLSFTGGASLSEYSYFYSLGIVSFLAETIPFAGLGIVAMSCFLFGVSKISSSKENLSIVILLIETFRLKLMMVYFENMNTFFQLALSHFAIIFEVVVFQFVQVTQIIIMSFDGNQ